MSQQVRAWCACALYPEVVLRPPRHECTLLSLLSPPRRAKCCWESGRWLLSLPRRAQAINNKLLLSDLTPGTRRWPGLASPGKARALNSPHHRLSSVRPRPGSHCVRRSDGPRIEQRAATSHPLPHNKADPHKSRKYSLIVLSWLPQMATSHKLHTRWCWCCDAVLFKSQPQESRENRKVAQGFYIPWPSKPAF